MISRKIYAELFSVDCNDKRWDGQIYFNYNVTMSYIHTPNDNLNHSPKGGFAQAQRTYLFTSPPAMADTAASSVSH
jgi:hypothetical protein